MIVSGLPQDLAGLARDIHHDNIRAGWWKQAAGLDDAGLPDDRRITQPRNVGELLALIHSEISEADHGFLFGLMDDKLPHRPMVEVELADTDIRVLDMLGYYLDRGMPWPSVDYAIPLPMPEEGFGAWISLMHRTTTQALEGFRKGDEIKGCHALNKLLGVTHFAATAFGYDLTGAIAEKRAFNRTRLDHQPAERAKDGGKSF